MDAAFAIALKKPRLYTDYTRCLICQCGEDKGKLQKLSEKGFDSLCYAVDKRQDEIADRLHYDVGDKDPFFSKSPLYHGPFRNQYTNKKTVLQKLRQCQYSVNDEQKESTDEITPKRKRQSLDYRTVCFICEKARNTKGHWKLTKVAAGVRQNNFHKQAQLRNDQEMLTKIHGHGNTCVDFIAADFRYHGTCMNKYMNDRITSTATCTNVTIQDTTDKTEIYRSAFQQLVSEMEGQLFQDRAVFYISKLCVRYRQMLVENGIKSGTKYRTSKLSNRFVAYYGARIQIVPGKGMSNLLCSSDITVGELFAKINSLQKTLEETELLSDSTGSSGDDEQPNTSAEAERMSYHSAKRIRHDLKRKLNLNRQMLHTLKEEEPTTDGTSIELSTETRTNDDFVMDEVGQVEASPSGNPSDATCNDPDQIATESSNLEFSYDAASKCIPDSLYNHVAWLVTDCNPELCQSGRVQVDQAAHEKILNLSQDIVSQVCKIPTPKQVGISLHILKETRSKRTVTMLNRFGNAISYDDAQRYMTSIAKYVEEQTERIGFFVPVNLKAGQFTHCAIDNLDFHEHTKDGTTLHATTIIFYQYMNEDDESGSAKAIIPVKKVREKSVHAPDEFHAPECYLSLHDRKKSRQLTGITMMPSEEEQQGVSTDMVWHLLRTQGTELLNTDVTDYTPPTWGAYNVYIQPKNIKETVLSYGPVIPKSPTDPAIVQEALFYCMKVTAKINQEFTIITCDQAIYDIAIALRNKMPKQFEKLILRMGGFHIAENFMGSISHLMKGSGIEDVLVEANAFLRGTVNKIFAGKDYYLMLRAFTLSADVMFQLRWEAFEKWLLAEEKDRECIARLSVTLDKLKAELAAKTSGKVFDMLDEAHVIIQDVKILLSEFDQGMTAPTARLWLMFLDMVAILMLYISAEGSGNWKRHLVEVQNMLPYITAAGHYKYATQLPIYLNEMRALSDTAPAVHSEFMKGNFTVHRKEGKFNGVWSDMALEQSYSREGKTALFKGLTQNPAAMKKYRS